MAPVIGTPGQDVRPSVVSRSQKRKRDDVNLEKLDQAVAQLDVKGVIASFNDLPLSDATRLGLKAAHFTTLTEIQAKTIPLAFKGSDILGAAKTGSGKTLAFIIPVLENLYRAQCVGGDAGLGAMIIAPTRELAIQIFEVLRKIGGKGHLFAAGLVIGGKGLREEQDALARMNIVVCTPGRILQHLSQTASFTVDNMRMLVLDEADRILDMGFQRDIDAIIQYLPQDRQTLLFSATQTKRISDLARLSLKTPEYVSVHEAAASSTPQTLQQNYVLAPLSEKLDTLWSFLQSAKKSKVLVFLSSGKQVRFVYESFRHMQPGIPLLHLHGRQKQTARLEITQKFSNAKHSCLFATDVVARGLDFPAVDWVVQVDCPEDADTYIHRVGRTARFERDGRAVLFLDPSEEEGLLTRLEQKRVPIERINIRAKKQTSIKLALQNMCFKDPQLKYLGQKAFASYVRSLHIQKDKTIFQLDRYALEDFAASLGLPGAPRIKFLKADAEEVKRRKNASRQVALISDSDTEGFISADDGQVANERARNISSVRTKYDRMFERQNQDILADHYARMIRNDETTDLSRLDGEQVDVGDEDLFDVKRRIPVESAEFETKETLEQPAFSRDSVSAIRSIHIPGAKQPLILDSKRREKLLKSKKALLRLKDKGSKLVFDDEGNSHEIYELEDEDDFRARGEVELQRRKFLEGEAARVAVADSVDKALAKEKRKAKREKRKDRDRLEEKDDETPIFAGEGDAFADFVRDAQKSDEVADDYDDGSQLSSESSAGNDARELRTKRQKKWFQGEGRRTDLGDEIKQISTLDDLEAEAARLLS